MAGNFFLQYLLFPAAVGLIAWMLNSSIERQKIELQRIQLLQSLVPALTSDNHVQALMAERIASRVDPAAAQEFRELTQALVSAKLKEADATHDAAQVENIVTALNNVAGPVSQNVQQQGASTINKLDRAKSSERAGFEALVNGNFGQAQQAFQDSENALNGYHQVYEIARFLRQQKANWNNPAAQKGIIQTIVEKYYRGAPADLLAALRNKYSL